MGWFDTSGSGWRSSSDSPAPSGYGAEYDAMFQNNPYRNKQFYNSPFQAWLHNMGFRSKYDAWLEQMQMNAAEYDAGIYSQIQQNEYNDPQSQAARMRQAGLNPDLQGLGDVANAAGPTEDPSVPTPQGDDTQQVMSIASGVAQSVMSLVPNIMSFATQLSQLRGIRAENDLKEMTFNDNAIGYADKFFKEGITPQMYKEAFEKQDFDNILTEAIKSSDSLARQLFTNKKAIKRFNLTYQTHARSLLAEMSKYKTYDEFEKYRRSLIEQKANPFYSDDDATMQELMEGILGPLNRWQQKVYQYNERLYSRRNQLNVPEATAGLESAQIANQAQYEADIDPALQASAENTANERASQEEGIIADTNEMFADIMRWLDSKGDSWYVPIAKTLVGIMRGYVMSQVHVNFGRHQQINRVTGQIEDLSSVNVFQ